MAVLGQIQGYLASTGMQSWQGLQNCAFWPHTSAGMQRHATLSYRRFAVCLLSNALEVPLTPCPARSNHALVAMSKAFLD